jgi:SAM-dependent methyltransferase
MPTHHHSPDHPDQTDTGDSQVMAAVLDLDAEVMGPYLDEITDWISRSADGPVARILDLGAGTGTGTVALARRFTRAEIVAVDVSTDYLARIQAKVLELGQADRVRTVAADLDESWPAFGPADLAWASMSIHHVADPADALRKLLATIRPRGLLAVLEMPALPRFLPADLGIGRPGLEQRCHDELDRQRAESGLHLDIDWAPHLQQAGFTLVDERTFPADPQRLDPRAIGRYAQASLSRFRSAVAERLAPDDRIVLDALLADDGPQSVLVRTDLAFCSTRHGWIARRP